MTTHDALLATSSLAQEKEKEEPQSAIDQPNDQRNPAPRLNMVL